MSTGLRLTATEYGQMVERGAFDHLHKKIELIRGEITSMNPAGPVHDDHLLFLTNWSVRTTSEATIRVAVQSGLGLDKLDSRPEPDLTWVRAARYLAHHPTGEDVRLAIEVSDSSLKNDLIEKAVLYAEAEIVEYWVVDVQGKCVHVFRNPTRGQYTDRRVAKVGEQLEPLEPCERPLDLAELFGT